MAGYNDTRNLIIEALMGRQAGTEIQPEKHQAYALNMLDYVRSVELVSSSTMVGLAEESTVPIQPDQGKVCYIAGVGQDRTVTFSNFIDEEGNPISITTGEMEGVFVILLWNMEHWVAYTFNTNIISSAESANFYYGYNIRKTYASVAAMNADSVNPIGTDGRLIKIGELVTVVNSTTPAENGYYSYEGSENGWLLQSGFSFEVVQTTGTDINKPMSQKAVTDELALKIDKTSVKQVTGTSETDVMSQKAVTDAITQLAGDVNLKMNELSVFIEYIIKNGNMVDTSNWLSRYTGSTLTASDNILSLTSSAVAANRFPSIRQLGIGSNFANKKLYIEYEVSVNNDICNKLQCRLESPEVIIRTKSAPVANIWYKESFIAQVPPSSTSNLNIIFQSEYQSDTDLDGKILRLKNVKIFDLTGIFGVGNEPEYNEFIQILSSIGDLYTTGVMLNKKLYADILKKANHGYTGGETIKTLKDVDLSSIYSKQNIDYDLEYDIAQKKQHTYSIVGSGVLANGAFFTEGNTKRTDYIPVKTGDAVLYKNSLAYYYCALAFYDINKVFLDDLKILGAGSNSGTHIVSDSRVRYVILTDYKSQPTVSVSYLLESRNNTADILLLQQQDLAIKKEQLLDSMYVFFENVIAIGDSVTAGTITDDPRFSGLVKKYSYPTQLSKLTGWTIVNSAVPGYTAKKWWNDRYALHTYTDFQLAIMEFGYNSALTDTIETDVDPYPSYLDYADTETGHYCRVIQAIKTQNPNIFFVLMISSAISGTSPTVINKIGVKYNIPVIDLRDNSIVNLSSTDYHGLYGRGIDLAHFNAIGYAAKAQYIKYELNKIFIKRAKEINDLRID